MTFENWHPTFSQHDHCWADLGFVYLLCFSNEFVFFLISFMYIELKLHPKTLNCFIVFEERLY